MRFLNNETLRNFSWIFFYVSLWKHAFSFLLLPFCSPSNTSSSSTFGSKFTTFGRFFTYTTAATTKSTKNYKSSHHAAHFPFVLEYIKIKGSLDKSDERRTLSWGAKCYILVVQGHPTRNVIFEIDILGTYTVATMNFSTSIFTKHVDIWYSVLYLSYCTFIGQGQWFMFYTKITMIFRYFAISAHFSQILLLDCVQNFKS